MLFAIDLSASLIQPCVCSTIIILFLKNGCNLFTLSSTNDTFVTPVYKFFNMNSGGKRHKMLPKNIANSM